MRRKPVEEKSEGMERWLLTYADMITLLMAFFIMMYSMSVLNLAKFREAAISIRSGFGGMVPGQGKAVFGSGGMFAAKPSPIEGDTAGVSWRVLKPLVEFMESADAKEMSIGEDDRGIVITLSSDNMLFDPGSSAIRQPARKVLNRVVVMLSQTENPVQIEGHTCDLRPRRARYPTNWELSTARATEVLRYLVEEKGLPAMRFSAAGYGSARPLEPNDNGDNRRKNRRVQIVLFRPEAFMAMEAEHEPRRISDPDRAVIQRRLD